MSNSDQLPDRLYAPVEAAYILRLSQTTVQRLCRTGAIEAKKPNKSWLISKQEIVRYIDEGPRKVTHDTDRTE